MDPNRAPDLARTTLQLLALAALIGTSLWIVRPFLVALIWAAPVAIANAAAPAVCAIVVWRQTRPRRRADDRRVAADSGAATVLRNYDDHGERRADHGMVEIAGHADSVPAARPGLRRCRWLARDSRSELAETAAAGPDEITAHLAPFARTVTLWFLSHVGNLGLLLVQFLLTTMIAAILYANGETAARGTLTFANRLAGPEGEKAMHLAAQAIRGVALGVVVTAIVQSILAGAGLAIAGVPFAAFLTAVMFILSVAQIGPGAVLIAAVIFVYSRSGALWGTGLLVWAIFCVSFDNVVRPMLIKRGADLPLLLIFAGVIGGLIAFGVIGLFIGPVVLAVAYTLFIDWVSENEGVPRNKPAGP